MKVIAHKMPTGVSLSELNWSLIRKMKAQGYGWTPEQLEYEIRKYEGKHRAFLTAVAYGGVTEDEAIELIRAKDDPVGCLSCRVIDDSELPAEQALRGVEPTFRAAWGDDGVTVKVNMPKARVLHMDRIRGPRNEALAKLDVDFMRALEAGDATEQQRVVTQKQILRDIPQTFDLEKHKTPEALRKAWPTELT